jgi:hypothetical protein
MGLIYNPTDSQSLVSALNANIRTADEMIESLNQASKHLIDALGNKTLSGAAFTAGKGMFSQLVIPTISKASQALDKLKSEAKQYEGFSANAGDDLLDEDKLNEQLQTLQMQQVALDSQISFFKQLAASHPDDSALNTSYADSSKQLSSFMSTTASDIQNVQDKLKKLHEFNTSVSPLFKDSTDELKTVSMIVLAIALTEFDKAGNFVLKVTNSKELKQLKELAGELGSDAKKEAITTILEETIQDGITKKGVEAGKAAAQGIRDNRFKIELSDGKIMGKTKGATELAMTEAENGAKASAKFAGRAVTGGFAVVGGVMDGYADYQKDKDVGKAVAHGAVSTFAAVGIAMLIPGAGWGIAAGIVAGVVVSKLINVAFEQKSVKEFFKNTEKNVGKAVSGFFGSVGKAFAW